MKKQKLSILLLAIAALTFTQCKKDDTSVAVPPKNYSEIKMSDIQGKETVMATANIAATNSTGVLWQPGDVYVFKTNENRYGKFQVVSIDGAANYKLTIKATVYNADGTEKLSNDAVAIDGTFSCDLDLLVETLGGVGDFIWGRATTTDTFFEPANGAKFIQYTF